MESASNKPKRFFQAALRLKKRYALAALAMLWAALPEWPTIPVWGAKPSDWNKEAFWFAPWGKSGVHKGIDIFAKKGTPVVSPTYGIVIFRGEIELGGNVVAVLGPKWRIHYFAHLESYDALPGTPVLAGSQVGSVGDSGNAKGKPAHLHYSVITLIPYVWLVDGSLHGWKKMFYLDPNRVLEI